MIVFRGGQKQKNRARRDEALAPAKRDGWMDVNRGDGQILTQVTTAGSDQVAARLYASSTTIHTRRGRDDRTRSPEMREKRKKKKTKEKLDLIALPHRQMLRRA